jgi:hypothetical protein
MGVQKLQANRALRIIPSNDAEIPFPVSIVTGSSTATASNKLIDTSVSSFIQLNIKAGDIVYNTTSNKAATVVSVDSDDTIALNADIFTAIGQVYTIYNNSPQTTLPNTGCTLYVGGAGNVNLVTIDGDTVLFNAVPAGSFFPVQVRQVLSSSTTATLINALW